MFELTDLEFKNLSSQIVTSSWGGSRYPPMVFNYLDELIEKQENPIPRKGIGFKRNMS